MPTRETYRLRNSHFVQGTVQKLSRNLKNKVNGVSIAINNNPPKRSTTMQRIVKKIKNDYQGTMGQIRL